MRHLKVVRNGSSGFDLGFSLEPASLFSQALGRCEPTSRTPSRRVAAVVGRSLLVLACVVGCSV